MLVATLSTVGSIPVASVALILGVHRLLAEGLVPTNLIGNAVATIVISKWEGALDKSRLDSVLADRSRASLPFVAANPPSPPPSPPNSRRLSHASRSTRSINILDVSI